MKTELFRVYRNGERLRAVYPRCCTSAYCGRIECEGCTYKKNLDAFNAWVTEHDARCVDSVWAPLLYQARK